MKKAKYLYFLLSIIVFYLIFGTIGSPVMAHNKYYIDLQDINMGIFTLEYSTDKKTKVMVQKGNNSIFYNINGTSSETFPLQMGDGIYKVSILENTEGNKYRVILADEFLVQNESSVNVYLQSIQNIKWQPEDAAIKKANELTQNIKDDNEKIRVIYEYLINNFEYDFEKLNDLDFDYLPDINKIMKNKKGICYDFSSLFAAMLRSVDIPTKLVKGYGDKIKGYHAWNEVYLKDIEKWVTIDVTYDIQMNANHELIMIKNAANYEKVYEY